MSTISTGLLVPPSRTPSQQIDLPAPGPGVMGGVAMGAAGAGDAALRLGVALKRAESANLATKGLSDALIGSYEAVEEMKTAESENKQEEIYNGLAERFKGQVDAAKDSPALAARLKRHMDLTLERVRISMVQLRAKKRSEDGITAIQEFEDASIASVKNGATVPTTAMEEYRTVLDENERGGIITTPQKKVGGGGIRGTRGLENVLWRERVRFLMETDPDGAIEAAKNLPPTEGAAASRAAAAQRDIDYANNTAKSVRAAKEAISGALDGGATPDEMKQLIGDYAGGLGDIYVKEAGGKRPMTDSEKWNSLLGGALINAAAGGTEEKFDMVVSLMKTQTEMEKAVITDERKKMKANKLINDSNELSEILANRKKSFEYSDFGDIIGQWTTEDALNRWVKEIYKHPGNVVGGAFGDRPATEDEIKRTLMFDSLSLAASDMKKDQFLLLKGMAPTDAKTKSDIQALEKKMDLNILRTEATKVGKSRVYQEITTLSIPDPGWVPSETSETDAIQYFLDSGGEMKQVFHYYSKVNRPLPNILRTFLENRMDPAEGFDLKGILEAYRPYHLGKPASSKQYLLDVPNGRVLLAGLQMTRGLPVESEGFQEITDGLRNASRFIEPLNDLIYGNKKRDIDPLDIHGVLGKRLKLDLLPLSPQAETEFLNFLLYYMTKNSLTTAAAEQDIGAGYKFTDDSVNAAIDAFKKSRVDIAIEPGLWTAATTFGLGRQFFRGRRATMLVPAQNLGVGIVGTHLGGHNELQTSISEAQLVLTPWRGPPKAHVRPDMPVHREGSAFFPVLTDQVTVHSWLKWDPAEKKVTVILKDEATKNTIPTVRVMLRGMYVDDAVVDPELFGALNNDFDAATMIRDRSPLYHLKWRAEHGPDKSAQEMGTTVFRNMFIVANVRYLEAGGVAGKPGSPEDKAREYFAEQFIKEVLGWPRVWKSVNGEGSE